MGFKSAFKGLTTFTIFLRYQRNFLLVHAVGSFIPSALFHILMGIYFFLTITVRYLSFYMLPFFSLPFAVIKLSMIGSESLIGFL